MANTDPGYCFIHKTYFTACEHLHDRWDNWLAPKNEVKVATIPDIKVNLRVRGVRKARRKINRLIQETTLPNIQGPTRTVIDEDGNRFQIEYRGPLTRVTVILPNGLRATGNARLHTTDIYNKEFGTALASIRASQRVLRKYEKQLAREGNVD